MSCTNKLNYINLTALVCQFIYFLVRNTIGVNLSIADILFMYHLETDCNNMEHNERNRNRNNNKLYNKRKSTSVNNKQDSDN